MAQVRKCDVVIAGGGPAGAACARRLVTGGFEVVVLNMLRLQAARLLAQTTSCGDEINVTGKIDFFF